VDTLRIRFPSKVYATDIWHSQAIVLHQLFNRPRNERLLIRVGSMGNPVSLLAPVEGGFFARSPRNEAERFRLGMRRRCRLTVFLRPAA
jgi:hypothetical protein